MGLLAILRQERYRKKLTPLPFIFTFANASLGFLAIIQSLEGNYRAAIYSIMLAAFMDVCDGRLARMLGATSVLGTELDSLADGISFCLAPAVVMYTAHPGIIVPFHFVALLSYVCAGLYRLARFNVYVPTARAHYTLGLPVPVSAAFVMTLVLSQEWLMAHGASFLFIYSVPFILMMFIAFLMVSTLQFKKHSAFSHRELLVLTGAISVGLGMAFVGGYPLLLVGVTGYILGPVLEYAFHAFCRWLF